MNIIVPEISSNTQWMFIATTALTYVLIIRAFKSSTTYSNIAISLMLAIWLAIQGMLSYNEFYLSNLFSFPPRFALNILPPVITVVILFNSKKGKKFIDELSLTDLALVSIVRIPVEIGLLLLATQKAIPINMTFEGWNFDILSGISAPIIALAYHKQWIGNKLLLGWNVIALLLVITIVAQAILSLPSPFQQLAFDQPNVGVLAFPFNWLPSFIVPVVFFCHFVSIRQLLQKKD